MEGAYDYLNPAGGGGDAGRARQWSLVLDGATLALVLGDPADEGKDGEGHDAPSSSGLSAAGESMRSGTQPLHATTTRGSHYHNHHGAMMPSLRQLFLEVSSRADAVVVARCSPTQKAQVVTAVKDFCGPTVRSAAIGDGGNDVSMILAASIGIGIEGVEGKQASMAADYSITKFAHCERLIMWHGRNSYLRSASLAQFVIHRGIVYAITQAVFSMIFLGSTMSVFNGYLLMLFPTAFTVAPVFALVLNEDQLESTVFEFPELYRVLLKGRALNIRSCLQWTWLSVFQGCIQMYLTVKIFHDELFQLVSIAFSSLLFTELFFVATCVDFLVLWQQRRLHFALFFVAEFISVAIYVAAVMILPDTFDRKFFLTGTFWEGFSLVVGAAVVPVALLRLMNTGLTKYLLQRRQKHSAFHRMLDRFV
jgi:phospholipid-translocating ATPase